MRSKQLLAPLALVLTNLFWAGNYIFGHVAVATMSPLGLTFWRWLLAAPLLLLVAQLIEHPDWRLVARRLPRLLLISLLGLAVYNVVLYWALQLTTPLNASLITSVSPLAITVCGAIFLGQRLTRRAVSGLLIGLVGVVIVLTHGQVWRIASLQLHTGDILILTSVVLWAAYTTMGRWVADVPPITATGVEAALAALVLAPFAAATGAGWPQSPAAMWSLLFIAIFPSVISFALWNMTVPNVGAAAAGASINLMPVFIAAVQVLTGQPLLWSQVLGGLVVISGVLLTTLPRRRPAPAGLRPTT